jgi:hypothetical protein
MKDRPYNNGTLISPAEFKRRVFDMQQRQRATAPTIPAPPPDPVDEIAKIRERAEHAKIDRARPTGTRVRDKWPMTLLSLAETDREVLLAEIDRLRNGR